MTEDRNAAALRLELDMLRHMLEITITTLPQDARDYILRRMWERHAKTEELARMRQVDALWDELAAAHDAAESLQNRMEENSYNDLKRPS